MKKKLEEWQLNLAEHTGQWAFVLSLSKRMIHMLDWIRQNNGNAILAYSHTVTTVHQLKRRGLVISTGAKRIEDASFSLTPAGEAVCLILEYAGLMEKPAIVKAA